MGQINGATTYLSKHFAYYIVWEESEVNASNNTSRVTAWVYVQKTGSYNVESSRNSHSLWIDGTQFTANNYIDMNPETTPRLLVSGSKVIGHNADGSKTINIQSSGQICAIDPRPYYTPYSGSASGDVALSVIPIPPTVSTSNCSNVGTTSLTANGSVSFGGSASVTSRGFCYSSSNSNPTLSDGYVTAGSGTGNYSQNITGLSPNRDYYVRAFAQNSAGTSYGNVVVQLTQTAIPTVSTSACSNIGTTSARLNGNITNIGGKNATRRGFCYMEGTSGTPTVSNSVIYEDGNFSTGAFYRNLTGLKVGSPYRVRAYAVNSAGIGYGSVVQLTTYGIEADSERGTYISGTTTQYESRKLYIGGGLPDESERGIYTLGKISTGSNRGMWIKMVANNYSARGVYIDGTLDGSALYTNLKLGMDNSALRNRVYVRGGTYLSDLVTVKQVADGQQTVFYLPEKPHNITIKEGSVNKTVGIKNINDFSEFDYLLSYQEKYVETDTAPPVNTVMTFTYKYDIPVLVAVEDRASIDKYGQFEFIIFDKDINTIEQARNRATAELTDYAESVVSGSFETRIAGFRAGQFILINLPDIGINNERFLVKSVVATSTGGGTFKYSISIVSTELLGILRFLINLLESDKNALDIDPNEVVDEITTVSGESFSLTHGTPVLTLRSGAYKYDDGAQWNVSEWWK